MKIEIAKYSPCLMLKDENNKLLDYEFINEWYFKNILSVEELKEKIKEFASKNNISEYEIIV